MVQKSKKKAKTDLTTIRENELRSCDLKKKAAREIRGLKKELKADWQEVMLTLDLVIEQLEGK